MFFLKIVVDFENIKDAFKVIEFTLYNKKTAINPMLYGADTQTIVIC